MPERTIYIDYEGNVLFCCRQWARRGKSFGNIEDEKILDIWNKDEYKKLREEVRKGIRRLDICKNCKFGELPNI